MSTDSAIACYGPVGFVFRRWLGWFKRSLDIMVGPRHTTKGGSMDATNLRLSL